MFTTLKPSTPWSNIAIRVLIGSVVAAVVLTLLDGILKGPVAMSHLSEDSRGSYVMLATWLVDFRYLAEQGVYAATVFLVGAKFIEMRTVLTVGFDRQDSAKMSLKGPDDDNVVWIG